MTRTSFHYALTAVFVLSPEVSTPKPGADRVISVCEVLSQRDVLRDKLITVRGLQIATDEGVWLAGSSCEPIITDGYKWKNLIWIELSSSWRDAAGVETDELTVSTKRINAELAKRHFDATQDRLILTYVGVLKTYDDLGKQILRDSNGARGNGYGHQGIAPVELIVKDVRDPAVYRPGKRKTPERNAIKELP